MSLTITYPETKRVDVVEQHFGQTIADPYRWLENDVRNDKEVAAWVESQNKVTNAYLNTLPGRDIFKNRLKQLYNYPSSKKQKCFFTSIGNAIAFLGRLCQTRKSQSLKAFRGFTFQLLAINLSFY